MSAKKYPELIYQRVQPHSPHYKEPQPTIEHEIRASLCCEPGDQPLFRLEEYEADQDTTHSVYVYLYDLEEIVRRFHEKYDQPRTPN